MGTYTDNGLYLPDYAAGEVGWGEAVNENTRALDRHLTSSEHWRKVGLPEVFVSRLVGLDPSDAGYELAVAGRPDYPFRTIAAAIGALPSGGGVVRLRGGSPTSAGAQREIYDPAAPIDLNAGGARRFLAIIAPGAISSPVVDAERASAVVTAGAGFPGSRGLLEALTGTLEGFHLEGVALVNPTGHGLDVSGARDVTLRRVAAVRPGGSGFRIGGASTGITVDGCTVYGAGSYGVELYPVSFVSPSNVEIRGGEIGSNAAAGVGLRSARGTGSVYVQAVRIMGVRFSSDLDENAAGSGQAILIRGGGNIDVGGCLFLNDLSADKPTIELDRAESSADQTDNPHAVAIRGNTFVGGPDTIGTWTGDGTYRGVHLHVRNAHGLIADRNEHLGGLQTTTFPVAALLAGARGCRLDFGGVTVGGGNQRGVFETVVNAIVRDQGSGNYGTWWDDALPGYRKWGTQPV